MLVIPSGARDLLFAHPKADSSRVLGIPAKLHPPLLGDPEGLGKVHVKVVNATGHQRVPAYRGSIGQSDALDPMSVRRGHAQTGVRVAISGCTKLGTGRRRHDRAAIDRRIRIADVGTVVPYPVVVAVEAVQNGERGARLKRPDA